MIDLYFWPTGNGKKIIILLEELGLPYPTHWATSYLPRGLIDELAGGAACWRAFTTQCRPEKSKLRRS